jgi:hypothetical protein
MSRLAVLACVGSLRDLDHARLAHPTDGSFAR